MATGFGTDEVMVDGLPVGTTSADIRKIFRGIYTPGIINGAGVTTSGSSLTYTVAAGVVAIPISTTEVVLAPVPATTLTVSSPGSARTDIIWVRQKWPSVDNNNEVVVEVGTSKPSTRVVELYRAQLPAGANNTNAGVESGDRAYSIPYGASLGTLHYYRNTLNGLLPTGDTFFGHGTVYLPTDRQIMISYDVTLSADGASGFDNSKYTEHGFFANVDGSVHVSWVTPGLHQSWQFIHFETIMNLSEGRHTFHMGSARVIGPGRARQHNGSGRRGGEFYVRDLGPAK